MYSSFSNQIFPVLHYIFSLVLLFILLPRWMFHSGYEAKWDFWYSGYVKMIFFLIISGYILDMTKLYEGLALLILFSMIIGIHYHLKHRGRMITSVPVLLRRLFDYLDGITKIHPRVLNEQFLFWVRRLWIKIKQNWSILWLAEGITLVIVLGYSMYLRFYDAFVNAAPPLSDSYVTLAWLKYINNRQLFHDGIYPQGFHIYLATISKFAAVDALYVLRYTGPLNTVMITAGLYVVVKKLTKNGWGGLTAAWIYGILWVIFPLFSTERQAATNSQEFAFVFIYPAVYFLIKFFQTERSEDLMVGLLSTAITGLVHSLGYGLLALMIGILFCSASITLKKCWRPYLQTAAGVALTGILSVMPLGAGYLLGKNLNTSSAQYLVSHNSAYHFTALNHLDFVALGSLCLLLLLLLGRGVSREGRFVGVFTFLTGISVFSLYFAGGVITHSTVIASRSIDLWGLTIPFCIGISVSFLLNLFKSNWKKTMNIMLMCVLAGVTLIERPNPIIPYKLEYNENIEQYLRISSEYLPQTWMIVSQNEGYAIVLGKGFHMLLGNFLRSYNPKAKKLTRFNAGGPDKNIPPHIFIFQEKKVFEVSKTNSVYSILAPEYKQRAQQYKQLTKWLKEYQQFGNDLKIYYQNQHIIVYQIDIPANMQNSM